VTVRPRQVRDQRREVMHNQVSVGRRRCRAPVVFSGQPRVESALEYASLSRIYRHDH
jgi:hypothetical protein